MGWCGAESRSAVSDRYDALSEAAELADLRDRDLELDESRAAVEVAAEGPPAESEAVTGASAESVADFLTADALAAQPEESPKELEAAKKKAAVEAAAEVTADAPAAEESEAATAKVASVRYVPVHKQPCSPSRPPSHPPHSIGSCDEGGYDVSAPSAARHTTAWRRRWAAAGAASVAAARRPRSRGLELHRHRHGRRRRCHRRHLRRFARARGWRRRQHHRSGARAAETAEDPVAARSRHRPTAHRCATMGRELWTTRSRENQDTVNDKYKR